ncbi:hypothetical protein HDR60_03865 [bacterium]|nr:hypothetical protein [bacterium]
MINLLNESDLNRYLTNIIYGKDEVPHWVRDNTSESQDNLKNRNWVEENKDDIVRAILLQYFKKRVREYMKDNANYFTPVSEDEQNLPEWAKNALSENKDIYRFDEEKVPANFNEQIATIRDYLYSMADDYVYKSLKNQGNLKIKLNFLKSHNDYLSFENTLNLAKLWHARLAEKSAKVRKDDKFYQKSLEGTELVMELSDGMKVYKLLTLEALDFEGDNMGHCVGSGHYDEDLKKGSKEFYSIRDDKGEPHVTFEIKDGRLLQCKGKQNKRPVKKHIYSAREFVEKQGYELANDLDMLGYIKLIDENDNKGVYDIYNIPKGTYKDIDIFDQDLTSLMDFNFKDIIITGYFNCSYNQLTSLEGAPKIVKGKFICSHNKLTNLEGGPEVVNGYFDCSQCELTTLKGGPKIVEGSFNCSSNKLTSLEGYPKNIKDSFLCCGNLLTSLEGGPEVVEGAFDCSHNQLTSLKDGPKIVKGNYYCNNNKLTNLEDAPEVVEGVFDCSNNQLTSLKGKPKANSIKYENNPISDTNTILNEKVKANAY